MQEKLLDPNDRPITPATIRGIDRDINNRTIGTISTYGILVGVFSFLAFTVAIIGMLHSRASSNVVQPILDVSALT